MLLHLAEGSKLHNCVPGAARLQISGKQAALDIVEADTDMENVPSVELWGFFFGGGGLFPPKN